MLYPTYSFPDALQWIPWLMLGLLSRLVFAEQNANAKNGMVGILL